MMTMMAMTMAIMVMMTMATIRTIRTAIMAEDAPTLAAGGATGDAPTADRGESWRARRRRSLLRTEPAPTLEPASAASPPCVRATARDREAPRMDVRQTPPDASPAADASGGVCGGTGVRGPGGAPRPRTALAGGVRRRTPEDKRIAFTTAHPPNGGAADAPPNLDDMARSVNRESRPTRRSSNRLFGVARCERSVTRAGRHAGESMRRAARGAAASWS